MTGSGVTARGERGSVLLLFPAAVLVVVMLAAITVDLSMLHTARRELVVATSQAADDGAAMVDRDALHHDGRPRLDAALAERVARASLALARLRGPLVGTPTVVVDIAAGTVTVSATIRVDRFFSAGVRGARGDDLISITSIGRLIDHR